jgi:hypothetical protein
LRGVLLLGERESGADSLLAFNGLATAALAEPFRACVFTDFPEVFGRGGLWSIRRNTSSRI